MKDETAVASASKEQVKTTIIKKEPDYVIFRLINENPIIRGRDDIPKYPPYIRLKNTDVIVWKDEKTGEKYERAIRFLNGHESIFVDEQEKNGRVIPPQMLKSDKNEFLILNGEMRFRPTERAKIQFARVRNANADSEHRTGRIAAIYKEYNEKAETVERKEFQNMVKEAMDKAYNTDISDIMQYASLLNISINGADGGSREADAIKSDFIQRAIDQPKQFLDIVK